MKPVLVLTVLVALVACGGKKAPAHHGTGDAAPAAADAAPAAALDSPEALWAAYQALHVGATKADAERIGRAIDALLSKEARAIIADAAAEMVSKMPAGLDLSATDIGFKILGEGAASRSATIAKAQVSELKPTGGGSGADLTVRDGDTTLHFTATREGDGWKLGPSEDLLVKEEDLFALPSGTVDTTGAASADAVATRWVAALNSGTGWDAYNLVAPSNRVKLKDMIAQMGGSGDEDVVRVFDKTIRDRRDRGITATAPTVAPGTDDRRSITFHYSDGTQDDFDAVREDGAWWIVMPL